MIANLPDPSKMTVGQKMMEMQSILGRPLNEPERLKLMGLEQTERAMNRNEAYAMIHSGWARFTNGSMSQGERIQYQLAWEQAGLLPGHRQNPVTKAIEYVNPSLPPELSRMRDVVMGQQAVEAYRQPSPFDYSGQVRDAIAPDLQNDQQIDYGSDEGQLQVQQSRDQLISMLPEGKGLYDMVGDTATVGGWLKEKMFNIPGIGDQLGIDPQTIENRQFARMMTDQAIRAFALNRKFPVQEIARLIEQYPLNPKLSTEGAMQSYIRAVDKAIDVAIAGRQMALQSGSISLDAQKDAVDTIQDMKTLKRILNVSNEESGKPLTLSVEELDVMVNSGVLKPGDEFVGTDGKTYRVRGQ